MRNVETIRLTELQRVIRDKLYESFPGFYWVIAEIAELKVNSSGHCYLELTDSDQKLNRVTARVRATIWSNRYNIISAMFASVTGVSLQPGITILFRATVEYHELYGLSLNISDIDPKYTAGEIALKREAIIHRLRAEGVIDMNKSLELPLYPRRIAVISSQQAAGYQDFVKQLTYNKYGFVFETMLFDAIMQGEQTEESVNSALDQIASRAEDFDAVAIIRGGGSQTDLAWFDNYNIAYFVSQFPLPVITGIGHDKDLTVTDMTAFKALKTPTAVAEFLISHTLYTESMINDLTMRLSSGALALINESNEKLTRYKQNIALITASVLRGGTESVRHLGDKLLHSSEMVIRLTREHLNSFERELTHLNPVNVLKRGYTITSKDGIILKDHHLLKSGDKITTHFEKGVAESDVTLVKDKK
ncbi:MAG TPA: exodeoxyribonuclease VII large subunit [Bacteroidales bacterium]|nr:exodeoxyribonuclease VII large subunit [Bacteroidales bacterium]HPT12804.1 exodeoxyribonuclease VII large subunit [Bacteroidales bacterium]